MPANHDTRSVDAYTRRIKACAFGLLHLLLTIAVGFLVGMCQIGGNWGDGGAAHGPDTLSGFLYILIRILQPVVALFSWATGQTKPLPLHSGSVLFYVDGAVVIATSFLFGYLVAVVLSRKRKAQNDS